MLRFAVVGVIGFLIDSAALYLGLALGLNLFTGRIFSYLVAATASWHLHRRVTFRINSDPSTSEWLRFLGANSIGGMVNLGGYSILVLNSAFFQQYPVIAVGIGALGGMVINYFLSKFIVFRA